MSIKTDKKIYIFDLDGVVYRGWELQPTAKETILALKDLGHIVRYYTNNSASSRNSYSDKLGKLGIPTPLDEVMTTSYATAFYLLEQNAKGKTVFRIGGDGIREELEMVGIHCIADDQEPDAKIDYVVVGIDRQFNYSKLTRAMHAIMDGAKFIATNRDPSFPLEEKTLFPGGGTMVAAVQTCTGIDPFVIGKPETYGFNKILDVTGMTAENAFMVGDRLDTDILVAKRAGAHSVLTLTGVNTREEALNAPEDMKPDRIVEYLGELLD